MRMGSMEKLPDGWIRKESRSRPNNFYYFNTKTGTTQWENPVKPHDKSKEKVESCGKHTKSKTVKHDERRKSHSTGNHSEFKINDNSKELKKRTSKTPAQDRIQKLVDKNKTAVIESLKSVVNTERFSKIRKSTDVATTVKRVQTAVKRPHDEVDSTKLVAKRVEKSATTDKIPVLFPPKTPAQERLKALKNNLSVKESDCDHDATKVFSDSFGIESAKPATLRENMDEAMDWEPCECEDQNSNYTFQQIESMAVDVLTDSAYIIPDTNVFIDSMASIKSIIDKESTYIVLIPFVVLQELDQLKHRNGGDSVSSKASRAIQYIYEQLKSKNPRLQGQKAMEDKSHVIDVTSPDDKILNCCLQLKNQSMDIILVTNDKNLSNKALVNGIEAITSKKCLERF